MPHTPENWGGPLIETDYIWMPDGYDGYKSIPEERGTFVYLDGHFYLHDSLGVYDPREDEKVKVSLADDYGGYLTDKLVDGYNISLTVLTDAYGYEKLEISTIGGGSLPPATCCGQVLFSIDGFHFTPQLPLTGCGWLTNDNGTLLVVG